MTVRDLLRDPTFRWGVAAGTLAAAMCIVLTLTARATRVLRRRHREPEPVGRPRPLILPIAALAFVIAATVSLEHSYDGIVTRRLFLGIALLCIGPFVVRPLLGHRPAAALAIAAALSAIPGAWLVADAASTANSTWWVAPFVFGSTIVGGALVASFDRTNARAGLGPVLLAISVLGMYATLPDTEEITIVLGVAAPFVVVGWPWAFAALGPATYGAIGLLGWVAAVGGRGRNGAVVGALACLGVMLVEPVVRQLLGPRVRRIGRPVSAASALVVALQCGVVAVVARTGGLSTSAARAAEISLLALAAGAALLALLLWLVRRKPVTNIAATESDRPSVERSGGI